MNLEINLKFKNSVSDLIDKVAFVKIPGGEIILEDERSNSKWKVNISSFLLAKYPVTKDLYFSVINESNNSFKGDQTPIVDVSWYNAIVFCNKLSRLAKLKECYLISDDGKDVYFDNEANGYRLPSEAEWEYACRAESKEVRYGEIDQIAWYYNNSGGKVHEVGLKEPNNWGLYDMIGNVWEWCWNLYDKNVYGPYRIFRGGGWYDRANSCRASCCRKSHPTHQIDDLGFRLARSKNNHSSFDS